MLERQDLLTLEEYADKRSSIRQETIQVKKLREVGVKDCLQWMNLLQLLGSDLQVSM